MRFARPPEGYRLLIDPAIEAYVDAWARGRPDRARAWDSIKKRLSMVAASEGYDLGQNRFTMVFRDTPEVGDTVRIGYVIHADSVRILQVYCGPGPGALNP